MANNFTASVRLDAGQSNKSINALTKNVNSLATALEGLDAAIKSGSGNIDSIAQNISKLDSTMQQAVESSRQLVKQRQEETKTADQVAKSEKSLADTYSQTAKATEGAASAAGKAGKESQNAAQGANSLGGAQREVESSSRGAKGATDAYSESLASHRYLMYDVGATYRTISTLLLAIPAATSAVAIAYEKDFAQVQRTTGLAGDAAVDFQRQLKQLSTEIPSTFSELSEVAKIGGQMGVAQQALESFTETVTRFVATSDGVNIDKASTAFGRLENMFNRTPSGALADPQFFERIGSAISYTGDNSVATEAQIIGMLEKTTASAKNAGLSIQETIAMSSAMVSSGLQPFLSSGFIIRFFGNFQKAAAQGGQAAADMARELGYTAEEFQNVVRNDPYDMLHRVVSQMKDMDSVEGKQFLMRLGINGVQDPKVLNALSENLHVLDAAMEDVNKAYGEADYLDKSSAGIFDTTAAGIQKLVNSFMNLGHTIGSSTLPVFARFLDMGIKVVSGLDDLVSRSKLAQTAVGLLMAGVTVAGGFAAFRSVLSFVNASLVMFKDAAQKGAIAGGRFGGINRQLAEIMLYSKGATEQQTNALLRGRGALGSYSAALLTTRTAIQNNTIEVNKHTTALLQNQAGMRAANIQIAGAVGATSSLTATQAAAAANTGRFTGAMRGLVGAIGTFINPTTVAIGAVLGLGTAYMSNVSDNAAYRKSLAETVTALGEVEGAHMQLVKQMSENPISWQDALFEGASTAQIGNSMLDLAEKAGISGQEIAAAAEEGSKGIEGLIEKIKDMHDLPDEPGWFRKILEFGSDPVSGNTMLDQQADAANQLVKELQALADEVDENARKQEQAEDAALGFSEGLDEVDDSAQEATDGMQDFGQAIDDAMNAVFGMVNAEGALTTALESMGKGLVDSLDLSGATSEGAANIQNYQRVVSSALQMMQQDLANGTYATVQEASAAYEQFFLDLEQQLVSTGVDPVQAQEMTQNALEVMQMTLSAEGNNLTAELDVDPTQAYDTAQEVQVDLENITSSGEFEFRLDADGQPATDTTWEIVNYIAEQMGITPTAVLEAINGNATENTDAVQEYLIAIMGQDYVAQLNTDPTPGMDGADSFYNYVIERVSAVQNAISGAFDFLNSLISATKVMGLGGGLATVSGLAFSKGRGRETSTIPAGRGRQTSTVQPRNIVSKPTMAPSLAAPKPNLAPFKKGYDDAAKAANKAGNAGKNAGKKAGKGAKGAGNAAKKAGKAGEEAAKRAAKAAQEWNKQWQDLQSWAGRVGEALSMAFDQKHAVQSAKDEYYTVLNGINDRLKAQKDRIRELTEETKRLNAERKVELNEAKKFEDMAAIAAKHGNDERAKDYRDQAKAMRERANEMSTQISANKAEQSTIQAGIGNLKGYSQAAIDNRNELRQLEQAANKVPVAYASIGASTATVAAQTRQWSANVKTHAKQLGYTSTQVANNTVATSKYIAELKRVPRTIPTVVSASHKGIPAVNKALNNAAKGRSAPISARTGTIAPTNRALDGVAKGRNSRIGAAAFGVAGVKRQIDNAARNRTSTITVRTVGAGAFGAAGAFARFGRFNAGGQVSAFNSGGLIPGRSPRDPKEDNLLAKVDNRGLIAVRSNEYIQPEPAVKYYGLDFMEKIRQMKLPKFYAGGSPGGNVGSAKGNNGTLNLSAKTINQLAQAISQTTILEVSREELARSVSQGQVVNNQKKGIFNVGS